MEQNFAFNSSGSAIVQFRVFDGEWNLSDISVSPAYGTGFSPSYVNFLQQMVLLLLGPQLLTLELSNGNCITT